MNKTDTIPAIPLSSLPIPPADHDALAYLCSDYRDIQDQISALDIAKKAVMEQIKPIADRHKLIKVKGDGWILTKSKGGRTNILPERLLEKGVKMEVIQYATQVRSWDFYTVTVPKSV